jgi:Kef-type K+ transport system membrane component KefB
MSFASLAVIMVAALLGPLLALRKAWHWPVVLGELVAGILLGQTGINYLQPDNATFITLANIGFALVMFVAGTHVHVRDPKLRPSLRIGALRAVLVGVVATMVAVPLSAAFHTGHTALYAVLMASSSAALILPTVDSLGLGGKHVLQLLPQITIADIACIVALPFVLDPPHALRSAVGAVAVIACGALLFLALDVLERRGLRKRLHQLSQSRKFALELRINLALLFALSALAVRTHVSIMLAGFTLGLAISAIGRARRLARQLFALTEGFLGPVFFIWLGASLNLRDLGAHPKFVVLGIILGLGAVAAHLATRITGQPIPIGLLASAQIGLPVAAATVGSQLHVLLPGEADALILGALITIGLAVLGGSLTARHGQTSPAQTAEGPVA